MIAQPYHDRDAVGKPAPLANNAPAPLDGPLIRQGGHAPALSELARNYMRTLLDGDRRAASALVLEAADRGMPVSQVYLDVLQPVQREVGRLWEANIISVTMEHFCTAATQFVMAQLFPSIVTNNKNGLSMVGACVGDDLHVIGINMVCDFFEMKSWETHHIGYYKSDETLFKTLYERNADILCLSVTMFHNLSQAKALIQEVTERFPKTKVLAGGLAFLNDPKLAQRIGAHGWARDALGAVELATSLFRSAQHG